MGAHELELGTIVGPLPGRAVPAAVAAEQDGYDVVLFIDSQNLHGDPYSQLALAAAQTSTIRLGTGVTNPVTRHAAVTAASILSVHAESGGRALLGIGRGDSSMGHIGRTPAPMRLYARYVEQLQAYLAGEEVDQRGFPSRIHWLETLELPKVPLDMACTGPRSIALAAKHAERVTFAVGAAPERIEWAITVARESARAAGRDPDGLRLGAWINATADDDRRAGLEAIRGGVATFAHFSGMPDAPLDHQPEQERRASRRLREAYDTRVHAQAGAPHAQLLDDDFLDWFAVVGSGDQIVARLRPLIELGLDHLYFVGATRPGSRERFATEVLPGLHAMQPVA